MMLIVTHNLTVNKNIIARGNVYVTDSIRAKNMEGIDANFRNLTSTNNVEIQNNLTVGADASINGDLEVKGYIKSPDIDKMNNKNRADSLYFQDLVDAEQLQREEADSGIRYSVIGLRAKVSADSAYFESALDADSLYFQDLINTEQLLRQEADSGIRYSVIGLQAKISTG